MSIRKLNIARRIAEVGKYPETCAQLLKHLPAPLITSLTAKQIAAALDALYRASAASKATAARDILNEGGVWDSRRGEFRALA